MRSDGMVDFSQPHRRFNPLTNSWVQVSASPAGIDRGRAKNAKP